MRRFALAIAVALLSPLLIAAGQPAPQRHLDLSDADRAELDGISAYLNAITTLKGGFLQIEPNGGVEEGKFYIFKPGKMRFEYNPPSPNLIVSDGHTVTVQNKRLNTIDRYPLSETPLGVILGDKIDLRHNPSLVSVQHDQGTIVIGMRTSSNRANANIALVFAEPEFELRQWTVIDNQGLATTVALRALEPGAALAPTLFILPDKNAFAPKHQE